VHQAPWPDAPTIGGAAADGKPEVYTVAAAVLGEVRKAKTSGKHSLRTEVPRVVVHDTAERLALLQGGIDDVREASHALAVDVETADEFSVDVEFATPAESPG
jgi:hypothetical protein